MFGSAHQQKLPDNWHVIENKYKNITTIDTLLLTVVASVLY